MIFVQFARGLRSQALRRQFFDPQNDRSARRVRAQLVAYAQRLARARRDAVDFDQPAFTGIVGLSSGLEDARRAQPTVNSNLVTHPYKITEPTRRSKEKSAGPRHTSRSSHQLVCTR